MELVSRPIAIHTALVMVKDRLVEVDHLPEDYSGKVYHGRMKYPNVLIKDLGEPLGIKINELVFDEFTLHGIIPVHYNNKTDVTECVIDYFTMSTLFDVDNIALSSNGKTTDSESVN